jgi:hypothetical protein
MHCKKFDFAKAIERGADAAIEEDLEGAIARLDYPDGSYVLVSGVRRERHRRMLDFLIAYAPPIPLAGGVAFFFDRNRAAEAVFRDRKQYTRVEALLADEMQRIHIAYRRPGAVGFNDFAKRADTQLITSYRRPYTIGDDGVLDALINHYGYKATDLEGLSYAVISREYIEHISECSLKLCYEPALPLIFQMNYVAGPIARYALSSEYLGDHPLHQVLDEIGAATGKSRETTVRELRFGESADLLAQLGITIEPKGPKGQLFLKYDSKRAEKQMSLYYR